MLKWVPVELIVAKPLRELVAPAIVFATDGTPEILKLKRGDETWVVYINDDFFGRGFPVIDDDDQPKAAIEELKFEADFSSMADPLRADYGDLWIVAKEGALALKFINDSSAFKNAMFTPISPAYNDGRSARQFSFSRWRLVKQHGNETLEVYAFDADKIKPRP